MASSAPTTTQITAENKVEKFDQELTKLMDRCVKMYPEDSTAKELVQLKNFRKLYQDKKEDAKSRNITDLQGLKGVASFLPLFERFNLENKEKLVALDRDDRWLRNSSTGPCIRFVTLLAQASLEQKKKWAQHNICLTELYCRAKEVQEEAQIDTVGMTPEDTAKDTRLKEPVILMMRFMRMMYLVSGGDANLARVLNYYENEVNPRERFVEAPKPSAPAIPGMPSGFNLDQMLAMVSGIANPVIKMAKENGITAFDEVKELSPEGIKQSFSGVNFQGLMSAAGKGLSTFQSGGDVGAVIKEALPEIKQTLTQVQSGLEAMGVPTNLAPNADVHTPASVLATMESLPAE